MGFTRPAWAGFAGDVLPHELQLGFLGLPVEVPRLDGPAVAGHDAPLPRRRPVALACSTAGCCSTATTSRASASSRGSRERHIVGIGLQMTTPGVPMVFAGDELGLEGSWGEDARRTMPWDRPRDAGTPSCSRPSAR